VKFEHILQVYWSKGFFFSGKLFYTDKLYLNHFINDKLYGLSYKFRKLLIKRLELSTFLIYYSNLFFLNEYFFYAKISLKKTINIILSQVSNVNLSVYEVKKLNVIRKYLIKSYQGYCHALGKPVQGQRTWSNSWNTFKCNTLLRSFISKTKQINLLKNPLSHQKINYKSVKKVYSGTKNINPKKTHQFY
jgi:hypothetical protein